MGWVYMFPFTTCDVAEVTSQLSACGICGKSGSQTTISHYQCDRPPFSTCGFGTGTCRGAYSLMPKPLHTMGMSRAVLRPSKEVKRFEARTQTQSAYRHVPLLIVTLPLRWLQKRSSSILFHKQISEAQGTCHKIYLSNDTK